MISIDFHYETFLLLFLVSALVICIVLKLKKRKFYDFIFNLSVLLYVLLLIKVVFLPIRIVLTKQILLFGRKIQGIHCNLFRLRQLFGHSQ